jgi:putative transposase
MLTQAKRTEARKWLSDISPVPLQQSLRHLDVAYKNFFNSRNGKRKGGRVGVPTLRQHFLLKMEMFTLLKLGSSNPFGLGSYHQNLVD